MFNTAVFDFYDTLCHVNERAFLDIKAKIAIAFKMTPEEFLALWRETGRESITGKLRHTSDRLNLIAKKAKLDISMNDIEKLALQNDEMFVKACRPYPDAEVTVKSLKEIGISIYLLSNASSSVEMVIPKFEKIFSYFDKLYFSHEHSLAKPDERFIKKLIEEQGIYPEKAVYIGDGNDFELDVAKDHGFTAVKIAHEVLHKYRFGESTRYDHEILSLKDLLHLLKKEDA